MKIKLFVIVSICILSLISFAAEKKITTTSKKPVVEKVKNEVTWYTDYEAAKKKAKEEKKLMMLLFTGSDWCGACKILKTRIFESKDFKNFAMKNLILIELDFPKKTELDSKTKAQNNKLQSKYKPKGFPCCVFLDSDEKEIGTILGYSEEFIKKMKKICEKK